MVRVKPLLLSTALLISLTACQSAPWREFNSGDPVRTNPTDAQKANLFASARMATLENKYPEVRSGQLSAAEDAYRNAPHDQSAALSYAKVLRQVNMLEQADMVLKPFADDVETANEDLLIEYSKVKLAMGHMDEAQILAQEAGFKGNSAASMMILGVALDAQGHHAAAEQKLRQALDVVGMDIGLKNKILNNLAVSMIGQGKQAEAQIILSQIQDVAGSNSSIIDANRSLAETL